jgi:hypothetical protein
MPTREQTFLDATQLFEHADYPQGLSLESAWLGIYQTLLWYEPINFMGFINLPHIIDSDKLRPSSPARQRKWTKPSIWQRRAQAISIFLSEQLNCQESDLPQKTNLLMKHPDYEGLQRQNILGTAFVGLFNHILNKFGPSTVTNHTEVDANSVFPGITFPGRSVTPRIDLLIKKEGIPLAIISAKWSLRHDRLSDITNECPIYKAAFERVYRSVRGDNLIYYVIKNEYDPARLNKLISDSCVDGLIHVHKHAVTNICQLDGRLSNLVDLHDFVMQAHSW